MAKKSGKARRVMRHQRVRNKVIGTSERPRLAVYRSLNNIYAQVIDDSAGNTLTFASSLEAEIRINNKDHDKAEIAKVVGGVIGERIKQKGITEVVFDRGGYKFHGRIKAVAEAARESGLKF